MSKGGRALTMGALEFLGGLIFQTFGIGHIAQGKVGKGIIIMLVYWLALAFNIALMSVYIGFVTMPLTWAAFLLISSTDAASSAGDTRLLTSR
jgi:hypothetical protein